MIMQNWLLVSFVAPICWALVNIIDLWLAREVFSEEEEATAIIGIFGILPWLSVFIFGFPQINIVYSALSILAGILYIIFTYFYFRALFLSDDLTLVSILMNISGLLVPLLASLLINERLSLLNYIGIIIVVFGSFVACFDGKIVHSKLKNIIWPMFIAILVFSLSMIIEEKVYQEASFYGGILFFSLGLFLGGIYFYCKKIIKERKVFKISYSVSVSFVIVESINLFAIVGSHYAIKLSPSVSYVAVIETTVPVFIMLLSLLIYVVCLIFNFNTKHLQLIKTQLSGYRNKIFAIILMAWGVYLLG